MALHKGSELKNVSETWDQNERERISNDGATANSEASANDDLDSLVKEAAVEYDQANKEGRILDGERATVNDNKEDASPDE